MTERSEYGCFWRLVWDGQGASRQGGMMYNDSVHWVSVRSCSVMQCRQAAEGAVGLQRLQQLLYCTFHHLVYHAKVILRASTEILW